MDRADDCLKSELTWHDVKNVWNDTVIRTGPQDLLSEIPYFLGRLKCLVDGEYVTWSTMDYTVDSVMEWRLKWPQPDDPAFGPLDHFLRRYHSNLAGAVKNHPICQTPI
jgi:hypothetical protein